MVVNVDPPHDVIQASALKLETFPTLLRHQRNVKQPIATVHEVMSHFARTVNCADRVREGGWSCSVGVQKGLGEQQKSPTVQTMRLNVCVTLLSISHLGLGLLHTVANEAD